MNRVIQARCHINILEHAIPITRHSNGEPLLKRSSSHSLPTTILLVVLSANGNGSAVTSKATSKVNLLNDDIY